MASNFRRTGKLRAQQDSEPDILIGEIVRVGNVKRTGFVEQINGTQALVFWHDRIGERELIELTLLKRAAANPAFGPDVREL